MRRRVGTMVFAANVDASGGSPVRAAASPGGGPQACPAGCARIQALLCHSERSESTNAASAETACRLCRARRRKTNEVKSRIYRDYQEPDSSSIFRSPQNDKTERIAIRTTRWNRTIHCSQTPRQTGMKNCRTRLLSRWSGKQTGRQRTAESALPRWREP
jgi:hypothetical protein